MKKLYPHEMYPKNFRDVEQIDAESFECALEPGWLERNHRNFTSLVFQFGVPAIGSIFGSVVAFCIYKRCDVGILMQRFAVAPSHRRQGAGRQMFEILLRRLQPGQKIHIAVPETNLQAQLFLRKMKCKAVSIEHGAEESSGEDLYHFIQEATADRRVAI
jgi:ribosomal protein S18 acetylase RimI-like enzyme